MAGRGTLRPYPGSGAAPFTVAAPGFSRVRNPFGDPS
jgi:hypothetical protein